MSAQKKDGPMHLYLSPHFDDAALSCGGQIAQLTRQGERVVIFTVMAGEPPIGFQHTSFTRELQERWDLGESPVLGRRDEDRAAAQVLGAEIEFGAYPDCVYRIHPETGKALYPDVQAIFGEIDPDDTVNRTAQAMILQISPADVIHAPLGVGHHVDHQLVRDMGLLLAELHPENEIYFYQEYPYVEKGAEAVDQALHMLEAQVKAALHPIDPQGVEVRLAAVACYKSQVSSFEWWNSPDEMAQVIRRQVERVGGEMEWLLIRNRDEAEDAR
jgi:LmbE family N-acetylglucosaminyl deacetylase